MTESGSDVDTWWCDAHSTDTRLREVERRPGLREDVLTSVPLLASGKRGKHSLFLAFPKKPHAISLRGCRRETDHTCDRRLE
jgi:hypothetical protein